MRGQISVNMGNLQSVDDHAFRTPVPTIKALDIMVRKTAPRNKGGHALHCNGCYTDFHVFAECVVECQVPAAVPLWAANRHRSPPGGGDDRLHVWRIGPRTDSDGHADAGTGTHRASSHGPSSRVGSSPGPSGGWNRSVAGRTGRRSMASAASPHLTFRRDRAGTDSAVLPSAAGRRVCGKSGSGGSRVSIDARIENMPPPCNNFICGKSRPWASRWPASA